MKDTIEICIQIDKKVRNIFKALTIMNEETMTEVIIQAIEEYIEQNMKLV
jgi:hypothetical protein